MNPVPPTTPTPRPDDGFAEGLHALLARGVDEAIITRDQAERLSALATPAEGPADPEHLRFVTGFADIFVTIGILLFVGAAGALAHAGLGDSAAYALVAAACWALAEFFTRRRRMALPSIVLLLLFSGASFIAVGAAAEAPATALPPDMREPAALLAAALATLLLAGLHYWRFRVPITVAAGAAALLAALLALGFVMARETVAAHLNPILVAAGLAVFALAMRFDLSDPGRVTRRADIAFWLHLLAAPLIVHPVLSTLVRRAGLGEASAGPVEAVLAGPADASVLAIVLLLSLVALVVDRRAILVSGLAYAGFTLREMIRQLGGESGSVALSLLALGAFVLLLSAGWRPLRTALLSLLPPTLRQRLPHPVGP